MNIMKKSPSSRLWALDGLRGFAAIAVMIFHFCEHNELHWLPRSWMAVDVFFVLSGLVLARSYGEKIQQGLSFKQFSKIRLIRLYPLYFIGLLLGFAVYFWQWKQGLASFSIDQLIKSLSLNLFLLPYFNHASWPFAGAYLPGLIFPLNCPAWSLFLEVFINIFFFLFFAFIAQKRKRLQLLFFILTLGAPVYLFCAYRYGGLFGGWGESNFLVGLTRVTYHFFLGVGLSQIAPPKKTLELLGRNLGPLSLCALFFTMSFIIPGGTWLGIFILAPLSVWYNLQSHWPDFLQPLFHWLGEISYPIYIFHYPIYAIGFLLLKNFSLPSTTMVLLMTFVSLVFASLLNGFDKKIRQIISRA